MVSLPVPGRFAGMMRAIAAWRAQTHGDRELVIVLHPHGDGRDRAASAIAALGCDDIRVIMPDAPMSLGALRNLAVDSAAGDAICQWDDDDFHHPDRIAGQLAAATAAYRAATVLQDVMMYDQTRRTLRWTNWAATPAGGHPGTLFCRRDHMPRYPDLALGEDLAVLEQLRDRSSLNLQAGAPHLYVYVTHAANSTSPEHHAMLSDSLSISSGLLQRREAVLRAGLAPFDFGAGAIRVDGANGPAFTL